MGALVAPMSCTSSLKRMDEVDVPSRPFESMRTGMEKRTALPWIPAILVLNWTEGSPMRIWRLSPAEPLCPM